MKEIVDSILSEEQEAKRLLAEARSAAERLIQDARRSAAEHALTVINAATETFALRYSEVKDQLAREKEKIIVETNEQVRLQTQRRSGHIDEASERVFSSIITIG